MKKILLFFFLLLIHYSSYSQSGKILYNVYIDVPNEEVPIQVREQVKDINEAAKNQKFELSFNNKSSHFKFIKDLKTEYKFEKAARSGLTSSFDLYYDKINKYEIRKMSDGTLVKAESNYQNWQVTKDSKKIDKYICFKATLEVEKLNRKGVKIKKTITAWYSPSLPYSYGPKNFYGLPGLILELTENKTTFLAKKIDFIKKDIKIEFPKGKTISKEEYDLNQEKNLHLKGIEIIKSVNK